MLELGVGMDILRGLGWLYLSLLGLLLITALWFPPRWWQKAICFLVVLLIFTGPAYLRTRESNKLTDQRSARYATAKALFDERCKTAGEKINRTFQNVDGVVWLRWRPASLSREQFAQDDPYGKDCSMEGCILQLLRGADDLSAGKEPNSLPPSGYRFVETIDPRDGVRYRYTGVVKSVRDVPKEEFSRHVQSTGTGAAPDGRFLALERVQIDRFSARFGLRWDDASTREDREHWIAGGSLKVIDLASDQVVAERIGYLIDTGQGSVSGHRDPWGWAKSHGPRCPANQEKAVNFVAKIVQPARNGEQK